MNKEVLVSEHETPHINSAIYHQLKVSLLMSMFGDRISRHDYCGEPHIDGYGCDCGYDESYNDKGELVWKKQ